MQRYILTYSRLKKKKGPSIALGSHQGDLNFFVRSAPPQGKLKMNDETAEVY